MEPRRVLVVEDDPFLQSLIADTLIGAGFEVETANNAANAKQVVLSFDPDAAVLDIELGNGPTGIDLADLIVRQFPHTAIIFLTHLPDPRFVGVDSTSIPAKAAYIRKETITEKGALVNIIESALRDGTKRNKQLRTDLDPSRPLGNLSKSQISVLRSIAQGLSNAEIAVQRGSTLRAVEHLIRRTFAAVGIDADQSVNARTAAARAYIDAAGLPTSSE
jgi:DNA-binding NarL/FixJ family response regulator